MMGRKPLPTHLKLLKGTARKHRLPKNEPKPAGDLLVAPEWLSEQQKIAWAYAVANMAPGQVKRCDRAVLTTFIIEEDRYRVASEGINASSLLVKGSEGIVQNPLLRIASRACQNMLRAAAELGFTPSSRSRIELMPDTVPHDEWDDVD